MAGGSLVNAHANVIADRRDPFTVLHVGKFYPPASGGMEKVVQLLCEGERAFVDSRVLVSNDRPVTIQESVRGVPVTRVAKFHAIGSVGVCPTFPLWMRRLAHDVMVIHEPNPLALVTHALVRPSSRLVVWFHSEVVRPQWKYRLMYRPFLRRVLSRADRIVVASPRLAEYAEELQDFRDKCVAVPFGLELDPLARTEVIDEKVRQIRGCPGPLVLFVGRMVPYKGVDVLLRAMADVDAHAILVGSGPLKGAWERLSAELGVANRVHFRGEVDQTELTALYHACDVFVLPSVSRQEAFGMVQLEAMACRKPVVSTDLPSGVPWVNQDGQTGIVVPPGDVAALRDALRTLLADPELRARLGARGRERVVTDFSVDRMIRHTTSLYRELIDGAGRLQPVLAEPSRIV